MGEIWVDIVEAGRTMAACRIIGCLPDAVEKDDNLAGLHVNVCGGITSVSLSHDSTDIISQRGWGKAMQALADMYATRVAVVTDPGVGNSVTDKMVGVWEPAKLAEIKPEVEIKPGGSLAYEDVSVKGDRSDVANYLGQRSIVPGSVTILENIGGVSDRAGVEISIPGITVSANDEEDLYQRARSLGYTDGDAARLADCFTNWDMMPDPCPTHPNHSTTIRGGYRVDSCEACEVIALSDDQGYTLAGWEAKQARWAQEDARIEAEHAAYVLANAGDSECVCDPLIELGAANLPDGGRACQGCGSVFVRTGEEIAAGVLAVSNEVIRRNQAKGATPSVPVAHLVATVTVNRPWRSRAGKRKGARGSKGRK